MQLPDTKYGPVCILARIEPAQPMRQRTACNMQQGPPGPLRKANVVICPPLRLGRSPSAHSDIRSDSRADGLGPQLAVQARKET
jgi:hypothetical protein